MKFTWIGGPSFRLELGPFVIVGDPVLADRFELDGVEVERLAPAQPVDLAGTDLVLVTSARADHCDPPAIARCATTEILGVEGVPGATLLTAGEPHTLTKGDAGLVVNAVHKPGETIGVNILREGEPMTLSATLVDRDDWIAHQPQPER